MTPEQKKELQTLVFLGNKETKETALKQLLDNAFSEGYAIGFDDGYNSGYDAASMLDTSSQ